MTLYATSFDTNFLLRGAACIRSLARQATRPICVLVLTLDDDCARLVRHVVGPLPETVRLETVSLAALEAKWPVLRPARENRTRIEYYFTLTPFLCREAASRLRDGEYAVYVDADLYFFSDPEAALTECDGSPVVVTEHRFPPRLAHLAPLYGRFNVGWLAFDNSDAARACLDGWAEDCIALCRDVAEAGQFADQKYLDDWPARIPGLRIVDHPGVNAAPWNVANRRLGSAGGVSTIDSRPLVAYHFHRLRHLGAGLYEADFDGFGALSASLIRQVYVPYVTELCQLEVQHRERLPSSERSALLRFDGSGASMPRAAWRFLRKILRTVRRERVLFENGVPLTPIMAVLHG